MLILILVAAVMLVLYIREKLASYSFKAVLLKSVVSVLFITVAMLYWKALHCCNNKPAAK